MTKITEDAIESLAIEHLETLGYHYLYGPDFAPDSDKPERETFEEVLLLERIESAVNHMNPTVPDTVRLDAIRHIQRLNAPELIANNEAFHRFLTEGIPVTTQVDGNPRGDLVWLVDFKNPTTTNG